MSLRDTDWMAAAACAGRDQAAWFPVRGEATEEAKRVCHSCPVRVTCLEFALVEDIKYGVWGGRSARQRDRMRRRWRAEQRAEQDASAWR